MHLGQPRCLPTTELTSDRFWHTDGKHKNIRLDSVIFVPKASRHFYSTGAATQKGCEARETRLTNKIYSSDGTLLIEGTRKQATGLSYFNAQILQGNKTNVPVKLSVINISQSDLWHQRLAHANYEVIVKTYRLYCSVVGRHLGCPRCTVIGTQCVWRLDTRDMGWRLSKPIACKLGGGKAPRLSEVHCDRDSVCVKTDT